MEYKKNHFIPKSIISLWSTQGDKYKGVHCYEITNQKNCFSTGEGSSPYSFAIESDLYVPKVNSTRRVDAEKWMSGIEGALIAFVKQADARTEISYIPTDQAERVLMGLLALEVRSAYAIDRFVEKIDSDPEFAKHFTVDNVTRSSHQAVVENIPNFVHETALALQPVRYIFLNPKNSRFILSDRPMLDEQLVGHRIVILSPTLAVAIEKNPPPYSYTYSSIDDSLTENINRQVALQARNWIVAGSQDTLLKYIDVTKSPEWHKRKFVEKVHYQPFKYLTEGWELKP